MAKLFGWTKATITWYDPQPSSTAFVLTSKRIQCTRAWYAKPTSILGQARQAASKAAAGKIARPTFYDTVVLALFDVSAAFMKRAGTQFEQAHHRLRLGRTAFTHRTQFFGGFEFYRN